jgi:hypothetical protein
MVQLIGRGITLPPCGSSLATRRRVCAIGRRRPASVLAGTRLERASVGQIRLHQDLPGRTRAGTSVFTCDNLAFSGEVKINRKHTRFAYRDLRNLTIHAYRDEPVQDWRAHDLIVRAVDCRAITASQVPDVVQECERAKPARLLGKYSS